MLIYIDESFSELFESDQKQKAKDVLDNLNIALRDGLHLIIAEHSTLVKIIEFDQSFEYFCNRITSFNIQYGSLIDTVSVYAKLSNTDTSVKQVQGDRTIIEISYNDCTDFSLFRETNIIFEDINDSGFYEKMLDIYQFHSNISIPCKYLPKQGGGESSYRIFKETQSLNKFCICVVDSDKSYPTCDYGTTATRVLELEDHTCFSDYLILPCHETENLIPYEYLSITSQRDSNKLEALAFIRKIDNAEHRLYYDMKKGISNNIIHKIDELTFWQPVIDDFHVKSQRCTSCATQNDCDSCSLQMQKGFGRIIQRECFENGLNDNSLSTIYNKLNDLIKVIWLSIGELLFSWCIACEPKYA